uniref:Uncharacterized protein n=1 Tax=Anguilla anguilla TaxID=7936 RepID=A0A0E9PJV6_ANGAN
MEDMRTLNTYHECYRCDSKRVNNGDRTTEHTPGCENTTTCILKT